MSQASFNFIITSIEASIIGIGLIGNVISIIIFSRRTFRNNSISTYCISLSFVELMTFAQFFSDIYSLAYNVNLSDQSDSLCKFFSSIPAFLSGIQPWIMVALAVDKLLCMRVNSISILKKKWFQCSIVVGIVLINTAIYIHMPILIKRREIFPGFFMCDLTTINYFNVSLIVNLLESSVVPFIVMVITSVITTRMLIKSRNAVTKTGQVLKERKLRDTKYAITSLSLNVLFILLKLPSVIFFTMNAFVGYFDMNFVLVASLTFYLNASLSFFIHFVINSLFRREFLLLFKLTKRNNGTSTNPINNVNRPIRLNQVSSAI